MSLAQYFYSGGIRYIRRVALVTATILATLWFGVYAYIGQISEGHEQAVRQDTTKLANILQAQLAQTFETTELLLASVANQLTHRHGDADSVSAYFSAYRDLVPPFLSLLYVDARGRGVASTFPDYRAGTSYLDRDYFQAHQDALVAGSYVGAPIQGKTQNKMLLPISRAIMDERGDFSGVIMALIDTRYLANTLATFPLSKQGAISIAHTNTRHIVARSPNHEQHFAQDISRSQLFTGLLDRPSGNYEVPTTTDGVTRVIAYHQMSRLPLVVLVGYGREDIRQDLAPIIHGYLGAAGILSLVIAFIACLFIRGHFQTEQKLALQVDFAKELMLKSEAIAAQNIHISSLQHFAEALLRSLPGCFYMLDRMQRMKKWNLQLTQVTGYEDSELLDKPALELIAPQEAGKVADAIQDVFLAGGNNIESFILTKTGELIPYQFNSISINIEGEDFLIGVGLDISDRKAAEAEITAYQSHLEQMIEERTASLSAAKEAAEASDRAKSAFLSMVSHELRTPLHGILGMTSLGLRLAENEKLRGYLEKTEYAAHRLLRIVEQILEYTYCEGNRVVLREESFCIDDFVRPLRDIGEYETRDKHIAFGLSIPDEVATLTVRGDRERLSTACLAVIRNAVKFTNHGSIEVSLSCNPAGDSLVLLECTVTDTGCGISEENLKRVFLPFEQAEGGLTRRFGGVGIGLPLAKRLIEAMGGSISVNSQLRIGSRFTIKVPLELPN